MDNSVSSTSTNAGNTSENVEETMNENVHVSKSPSSIEKKPLEYTRLVVPKSKFSKVWKYFQCPATEEGDINENIAICTECTMVFEFYGRVNILRNHLQKTHPDQYKEIATPRSFGQQFVKKERTSEGNQKRREKNFKRKMRRHSDEYIVTDDDDDEEVDSVTAEKANELPSYAKDKIDEAAPRPSTSGRDTVQCKKASDDVPMMTITTRQSYKKNKIDNSPSRSSIGEESVTDMLLDLITIDLQVPEVPVLQSFAAAFGSPGEITDKNKWENEKIPQAYESLKVSVSFELSRLVVDIFCLAIDEWRSDSDESYVTFTIYYQNPEKVTLECKVLRTVHAPRDWTEIQCGGAIDSTLRSWNLRVEKITVAVVGTTRSELLKALRARDIGIVPCLLHTLQLCVQACFENPEIADVLAKCRSTISAINCDGVASSTLPRQEKILTLHENSMMIDDYPPVWTSTYNMLEQTVQRRQDIVVQSKAFQLTENQWKIMSDLVDILRPLKDAIDMLSEEKIPSISILKPLLSKMTTSDLKINKDDGEISRSFKESLSDMLCKCYADESVALLLKITTNLDPRYKEHSSNTIYHKIAAVAAIKKMINDIKSPINEIETVPKSGMERLLGDLCASKNTKTDTDVEMAQYDSEAAVSKGSCPLRWWKDMSSKYPNIYQIAMRYNCVPMCSRPIWQSSTEAQVLYHTRRAALPSYLIEKLLFLHGNRAAMTHDSSHP